MRQVESIFEVEFKYKADHVSLGDFLKVVVEHSRLNNVNLFSPAGTDLYFQSSQGIDEFQRLRIDSNEKKAELTYKKKLSDSNSWKRIEIDLELHINKGQSKDLIEKTIEYTKNIGFRPVFNIFKKSFVVRLEKFVYAYYVVDHIDTYVELEARKDVFTDKEEAFKELEDEERACLNKLGITKEHRLNENLYEIYRKKKCV